MSNKLITITSQNFDELMNSEVPVMVDVWATWCGPCKMISPFIEQIAGEFEGKAVVGKLDAGEYKDIASRLGVTLLPTVLVLKKGEVVGKEVGAQPKKKYQTLLEKNLN